jgi:hypothetical protein
MPFELHNIVPWGRSAEEYVGMFALTENDLRGRILDCAAGPASFAAELHAAGHCVIAADPLFAYSSEEIRLRVLDTRERMKMINSAREDRHRFIWNRDVPDPEALGRMRLAVMQRFLEDYPAGQRDGRYIAQSLPKLDLPSAGFDLALCSHCLFLYSGRLTLEFHVDSIRDMCRVARETRIFPLVDLAGRPSAHLDPVRDRLISDGLAVSIVPVRYEFVKGANQMMVVREQS